MTTNSTAEAAGALLRRELDVLHAIFELPARLRDALALRREQNGYDAARCGAILIRHSGDRDEAALERLATLNSRRRPEGSFLVAEIDGRLAAATPLNADAESLGDPFRPTASLCELLELGARQSRRSQHAARRDRPRRAQPDLRPRPRARGEQR
jgi:hypothetical protein